MDKYIHSTEDLRREFGTNKEIPARYEEEILVALSHYPELKEERVRFVLVFSAPVPYGTKPSFKSCFLPRNERTYTVTILEEAADPEREALIKNLDRKMRIGVLGHELGHVLQYSRCEPLQLLRTLAFYMAGSFKRKLEREADMEAIKHGLGKELLLHAEYIRLIPGYADKRPELNRDYLKPEEIVHYMEHPSRLSVA